LSDCTAIVLLPSGLFIRSIRPGYSGVDDGAPFGRDESVD